MSKPEQPRPVQTTVTLTPAEEQFVLAVARGLPVHRAATSAGYTPRNGSYLARRLHIATALCSMAVNLADIVLNYLPADARP